MILALNIKVATVVRVRGSPESNLEEASTDGRGVLSKYFFLYLYNIHPPYIESVFL